MTLPAIANPLEMFLGLNGSGINSGHVYIGVETMDPETNPQAVFWDAAGTIPATQPLDVQGGYLMYLGAPGRAYTAATYSIRARNAAGAQVFYLPSASQLPQFGIPSITDFGASGDGTTDDTAAFLLAAAPGLPLLVPPGAYKTTGNVTFTAPLYFTKGAVLHPANGNTITLNGGLVAGVYQIFANATAGGATIVFDPKITSTGYPEWWGAAPVDWSAAPTPPAVGPDCLPGLKACTAALGVTKLQAALYFTTARWNLNTSDKKIEGTGYPSETLASAIVVGSGSLDAIYVGSASDPGSINAMARNIWVENVMGARYSPVVPPAPGSEFSAPSGIRVQYALDCVIDNFLAGGSYGHSIGINVSNSVGTRFRQPRIFRSAAGTTAVNDIFWCLGLFGVGPYSLESINFLDPSGNGGYTPPAGLSRGISILTEMTDIDILRPEFNGLDYGYYIDCTGPNRGVCVDNNIREGRFDQCKISGGLISNCPSESVVNIDAFHSMESGGIHGVAAIQVINNGGVVNISETSSCFANANVTTIGLKIVGTAGNLASRVTDHGCSYVDFFKPITINAGKNCLIQSNIHMIAQAVTGALVAVTGGYSCVIRPRVLTDSVGLAPAGVTFDATTTASLVDCAGIDAIVLPGSSRATLFVNNAVNILTDGWYATNEARGIGTGILTGTATYDPPSLADGAGATTPVTVTGAAMGDLAVASFSLDLQGITLTPYVSSANTVSVRFQNESGGVLDLASGTLKARVSK